MNGFETHLPEVFLRGNEADTCNRTPCAAMLHLLHGLKRARVYANSLDGVKKKVCYIAVVCLIIQERFRQISLRSKVSTACF